jgi:hypothetical protein
MEENMPADVKNEDVLQNIEMAVVQVYRDHPTLADYQVDAAYEALGRTYVNETRGKAPIPPKGELPLAVYEHAKNICDWRLGRQQIVDEENAPLVFDPLSMDEMLECLKRLRKSVALWNKRNGSQGYLQYVNQFLP